MNQEKTILLVDDDVDLLENTAFMIKEMGYTVVTAGDGEEAVSRYREWSPDLVLMDVKMPKLDGYEAFFKIKQYDKDAKVILITAYKVDEGKHKKAEGMSLVDTISKPYSYETLERAIEAHGKKH